MLTQTSRKYLTPNSHKNLLTLCVKFDLVINKRLSKKVYGGNEMNSKFKTKRGMM